jgi:hypothetical protein
MLGGDDGVERTHEDFRMKDAVSAWRHQYPEGTLLQTTWLVRVFPSFDRVRKGKAAQLASFGGLVTSRVCLNARMLWKNTL